LASAEIFTSPGSVRGADDFAEICDPLLPVAIDGASKFQWPVSLRIGAQWRRPIGPTPNECARIFFFTMFLDVRFAQWHPAHFSASESHTIREFAKAGKQGN